MKYNRYPLADEKDAYKKVYDNIKVMKSYMFGVAISQFLWSTHYAKVLIFYKNITKSNLKIKNYLEVGSGHGLFFLKALENLREDTKFDIVDISSTSIKITKSVINFFYKGERDINYYKKCF